MGFCVLRVISADPDWVPAGENANHGLKAFRRLVPGADDVTAEFFGAVQFVAQGESVERVSCSGCGEPPDVAWWKQQMDAAWSVAESRSSGWR